MKARLTICVCVALALLGGQMIASSSAQTAAVETSDDLSYVSPYQEVAANSAAGVGAGSEAVAPDSAVAAESGSRGVAPDSAASPGASSRAMAPDSSMGYYSSADRQGLPTWPTAVDSVMDRVLGLAGEGPAAADSVSRRAVFHRAGELKGLWVVRQTLCTEQGVRDAVAAAQENGFNALFVQVRGRGETYYRSRIDPVARCIEEEPDTAMLIEPPADDRPVIDLRRNVPDPEAAGHQDEALGEMKFDPLALLVDLAHSEGIEVHAWMNVYLTWSEENPHPSPRHIINRHPEWITTDKDGVRLDALSAEQLKARWIEGHYLSPAIPGVKQYLIDISREIASSYNVDGVHLDYVRYPGRGSGIDEYSCRLFADEHGFDPRSFLSGGRGENPPVDTYWAVDLVGLWEKWRADQVTSLVSSISEVVRSCRPGIAVSAAVRPDPSGAASDYGQEWAAWLERGYIDFAAPMLYMESTTSFFAAVNRIKSVLPDSLDERVMAGIALYNQAPRRAGEKMDVARAAGFGGFVLFSYNSAMEWKRGGYLPSIRAKIMGEDTLDRTALGE